MDRRRLIPRLVLLLTLLNGTGLLGMNLVRPARADPPLTVDMIYAAKERTDVRFGTTYLGYHVSNTDTRTPAPGLKVYFNEVPGQWYTNAQGWCIVQVSSWDIGRMNLTIDSIVSGSTQTAFQQLVPDSSTVFDKVIIELITPEDRIGVDTVAPLRIDAYYASDEAPFQGELIFNYPNFTSTELGPRTYFVEDINDHQYGITQFETDTVEIISDRVNVTFWVEEDRIGTGSEAEFEWTAFHELDGAVFQGWIEFNYSLEQEEPGVYTYAIESIFDTKYDVSTFVSNTEQVVFDEVVVTLEARKERIDVGEEADISWSAHYWYNSEPFYGEITLNRDSVTSHKVGAKDYFVQGVEDPYYGLTSFDTNVVEVKWDTIYVELQAVDYRIDLGQEAEVTWKGTYQSDGFDVTEFLDVDLTPAILTKNSVGELLLEVAHVTDNLNGIRSFSSNYANVVWDRLEVELVYPGGRTEVGSRAPLDVIATYEYDGAPFTGEVNLDGILISDEVGSRTLTVSSIVDDEHGIMGFTSNKVSILWDEILVDETVNTIVPGKTTVSLDVYYASDGHPVTGAEVYVGGKRTREVEPGIYTMVLTSILPFSPVDVDVRGPGIDQAYNFGNQLNVGNIGLYAAFLATAVAATVYRSSLKLAFSRK
ncbi:hypothetical protein H8E65_10455 [Candidatus Bathyarchaeota archaeon]|nr:hypothetical protein [Candidatus Bathyarchaeota archaeon]MBL7080532.1 hypothetical protein [Candidatus Bathyarchaeota archaeon]